MSTCVPGLSRFPEAQRAVLAQFAADNPRLADLALTFPLLFFLLATTAPGPRRRDDLIRLVVQGRQLSEVAKVAGVPLCLRRLPPEACEHPLDWVDWSAGTGRYLGNQIPADPVAAANWLAAVYSAARICEESFALWVGRCLVRSPALFLSASNGTPQLDLLAPLAIHAWHSQHAESDLRWMAFTPWSPRMGLETAIVEARYFLNRLKLYAHFGRRPIADSWIERGTAGNFAFVPLLSFWDVMEERIDMRNCLDCYADKLARNESRLFGVRLKGRKVATLELAPERRAERRPVIVQLKGPGNADVPVDIWHAAFAWLAEAPRKPVPVADERSLGHADLELRTMLQPYFAATGLAPVSERYRMFAGFAALDRAIVALAAKAGVGGWPFRQ